MLALSLSGAVARVVEVYLGLGSNRQRYTHLARALDELSERFGKLGLSRVFESESVGFQGSLFLNMVVSLTTDLSVAALAETLRAIEYRHGRQPNAPKYGPRTLDIDLLLYGDATGVIDGVELPRGEVLPFTLILILAGEFLFMPAGLVQAALAMRAGKLRQTAAIAGGQIAGANLMTAALVLIWPSALALVLPRLLAAPIWLVAMRRLHPWRPDRSVHPEPLRPFLRFGSAVLGVELVKALRLQAK